MYVLGRNAKYTFFFIQGISQSETFFAICALVTIHQAIQVEYICELRLLVLKKYIVKSHRVVMYNIHSDEGLQFETSVFLKFIHYGVKFINLITCNV